MDTLKKETRRGEAGFSLIELVIAMAVTLVIMTVASQMLAMSLAIRTRENQRAEAVADAQRALQVMTREISNAGFGLTTNGLLDANSDNLTVRVRSNLNAFSEGTPDTSDSDEDVVYAIINNETGGVTQRLITRQDVNTGQISPLANRIDTLQFEYLNEDGTTAPSPSAAERVRITVSVTLPAVGSQGSPGYQPPTRTQLVSDAVLRNQLLND